MDFRQITLTQRLHSLTFTPAMNSIFPTWQTVARWQTICRGTDLSTRPPWCDTCNEVTITPITIESYYRAEDKSKKYQLYIRDSYKKRIISLFMYFNVLEKNRFHFWPPKNFKNNHTVLHKYITIKVSVFEVSLFFFVKNRNLHQLSNSFLVITKNSCLHYNTR